MRTLSYLKFGVLLLIIFGWPDRLYGQQQMVLSEGWQFLKGDLGSVWEAVRPAPAGSPQAVPLWDSVRLPHCFNAQDAVDPDKNYYEGPGWYRSQIAVHNPYQGGRTLLHFEGSGQKTTVYVYTTKVGSHVGGYDQWEVDITDAVQAFLHSDAAKKFKGKVPISIRCDNSRDVEMIPSDMVDFTVYGGLYRNVTLQYLPAVSLQYLHLQPQVDAQGKKGTVHLRASFYNPDSVKQVDLAIRIFDPQGTQIFALDKKLAPDQQMQAIDSFVVHQPTLWSPEHPALYRLKANVHTASGEQQKTVRFGFRHFTFLTHGPFLFNGKRLLLKGTHRHEDWANVGAAETHAMVRREFQLIKDMGANFIRLAHYQQSDFILNLCDSLGLLVWEEIPWNRGGIGGLAYRQQAKRMLTNMINQHYNHPAVIFWSLGNEIDWPGDFPQYNKDTIRAFLSELNTLAHRLDPNRKTTLRRCDFCRDIVDVYSPSIWAGWYSGRYTEYRSASHKQMERVAHFFHAEWGADALAGRHAEDPYRNIGGVPTGNGVAEKTGDAALTGGRARVSKDGDWSETYQCDLIDWYLKEQQQMNWLTGTAYWVFKDFATPLRPDNPIPYVNTKGVVERDLTPKESYYVFQSYWSKQPMVHLYGHSWPVRWGPSGKMETLKVYSNCETAELWVNGKSYGRKKRNSSDFPAAGLRWEVPMAEGHYEVHVTAYKDGTAVTDSMHFRYQTEKWGDPARLTLAVQERHQDTTTVIARAYDNKGVLCLDARNFVRFSIAGDGRLIDDQGTSTGSRKIQLANGRAVIRIKNNQGQSTIGVRAKGLKTALLRIPEKGTPLK